MHSLTLLLCKLSGNILIINDSVTSNNGKHMVTRSTHNIATLAYAACRLPKYFRWGDKYVYNPSMSSNFIALSRRSEVDVKEV